MSVSAVSGEGWCACLLVWTQKGFERSFELRERAKVSVLTKCLFLSLSVADGPVVATVDTEGNASNRCHIHIPKMLPAPVNQLTDEDKTVIEWALEHNVGLRVYIVCVCVYVCVCVWIQV